MKNIWIMAAALALVCARAKADEPAKGGDEPPASTQDQLDALDKGADAIDVSKYPKRQQENYREFVEKCAKCHTLARPINSQYALPEEWTAYVEKMRHKKRSGIDDDDQKAITDFLIYDSSVRKKDLLAKKLKEKAAKAGAKAGEAKPKN